MRCFIAAVGAPSQHSTCSMSLVQALKCALAAQQAAAVQDCDGSAWSGPKLLRLVRCKTRVDV